MVGIRLLDSPTQRKVERLTKWPISKGSEISLSRPCSIATWHTSTARTKLRWEAEKAAAIIQDYAILTSESRNPTDHDVLLVVMYKNWGALDGLQDRTDAIANRTLQSTPQQRDQQLIDRGAMRDILGNRTYQRLLLR